MTPPLLWPRGAYLERAGRARKAPAVRGALRVARLGASITPVAAGGTAPSPFAGYGALGSYRPSASTTGVIAGTTLTPMYPSGGVYRPVAGETIENRDIYGIVRVNVANVTIRNCRIRGVPNTQSFLRLVTAYEANCRNLLVEDCTLIPDDPIGFITSSGLYKGYDGIAGHDYTARRNRVENCCDGFGVFNTYSGDTPSNVVIEGNYVTNHAFYYPTGQGDSTTHNDCVQVQSNTGTIIRWNFFNGVINPDVSKNLSNNKNVDDTLNNACVQMSSGVGSAEVTVTENWLYGGGSSTVSGSGTAYRATVTKNRFGRNSPSPYYLNPNAPVVFADNVYDDDNTPVYTKRGA